MILLLVISKGPDLMKEIMSYDKAIADYNKITILSEFDMRARKSLKEAQVRLYELNREKDAPDIAVVSPVPVKDTIELRGDKSAILITQERLKTKARLKHSWLTTDLLTLLRKMANMNFCQISMSPE